MHNSTLLIWNSSVQLLSLSESSRYHGPQHASPLCPSPTPRVYSNSSGLISFRMDWLDLLAVQGTLKSLLQHHSSKASILQRSAFFIPQLSHPYMSVQFSSVARSCPTLQPHEPQHARPPGPSPTPRIHLNPCTLSR